MSTRKRRNSSHRRASLTGHKTNVYNPTEEEVDHCEYNMDLHDLRASDIFKNVMPNSFSINGRRVPRSQLRKRELCREYLRYGGKVSARKRKALKHWTPPRKISQEERAAARLSVQKTRDHHGSTARASHGSHRRASIDREPANRKTSTTRRPSLPRKASSSSSRTSRKPSLSRADSLERYMQRLRVQDVENEEASSEVTNGSEEEEPAEISPAPEEDDLEPED